MEPEPTVVQPELTIGRFLDEIARTSRHSTYPVVERGRVLGLLPMRCIVEVPRAHRDTRTLRDCMLPRDEVPQFAPEKDLAEALAELIESDAHRGLVVEGERLAGLLSITHVARALELGAPPHGRPERGSVCLLHPVDGADIRGYALPADTSPDKPRAR
jgi:CBS domain-containing protein